MTRTADEDTLKSELAALGLRLVRRAAGKRDSATEPLADDALDTFKTVGAWEVANRKVKAPKEDDPDGTFGAIKNRIAQAGRINGGTA
jgi:hypothetical protein